MKALLAGIATLILITLSAVLLCCMGLIAYWTFNPPPKPICEKVDYEETRFRWRDRVKQTVSIYAVNEYGVESIVPVHRIVDLLNKYLATQNNLTLGGRSVICFTFMCDTIMVLSDTASMEVLRSDVAVELLNNYIELVA